jgi:hypothetical protein
MKTETRKILTADDIVEENFVGLSEFIKDKDILNFYKGVICECMKGHAEQYLDVAIDKTYIADDNHNPIITLKELVEIKNSIQ